MNREALKLAARALRLGAFPLGALYLSRLNPTVEMVQAMDEADYIRVADLCDEAAAEIRRERKRKARA